MNESVYSRYHQGNSSATFSKAPTNATFTPRYSNQEDCIGNNSNIGDIFDLSVHKFNDGKSPEHEHNKLLINESKKFGGLPETSSILEERNEIDKRIVNNQSLERRILKTKEKLKLLIPKGKVNNAKEIIVRLEGERKSSCSGLQDLLCGNFYCLKENNFITSKKSSARIERLNENDNYDIYLNRKNTETPLEKETLSYLNKSENSGRSVFFVLKQ